MIAPPVGEPNKSVEPVVIEESPRGLADTVFDEIWGIPVLYDNPDNPFVQMIAFTGRYQGQAWGLNSNEGSASGWENRRARFGGKIAFLQTWSAAITFNANLDGETTGRFVESYEDFALIWNPAPWFEFEIGLYKVPITNEWRESSNRIITVERSNFINQAVPPKLGGFLITGEVAGFTDDSAVIYGAGLYTASRDDDWELPTFDGSALLYGGLGYRWNDAHELRFDNAVLTDNSPENVTRPYSYVAALSYEGFFFDEKLRLQSDLVTAVANEDQGDLFGLIILPSYRLTPRIELVGRYQFLVSDEETGVGLQRRYERRAPDLPSSRGNNYHALYAGVNYYLYKDRMKVMGGLEYSHIDLPAGSDFDQFSLFGAFRVWF